MGRQGLERDAWRHDSTDFLLRSGLRVLDRSSRLLVPLSALLLLSGCSSLGYYSQLARGQWHLLQAREPVAEIIADPARDATLRKHLAQAEQARAFASTQLKLPDNRSYRVYADIGRPFVVWNVFATPSLTSNPSPIVFLLPVVWPIAATTARARRAVQQHWPGSKGRMSTLAAYKPIRHWAGSMTLSSVR